MVIHYHDYQLNSNSQRKLIPLAFWGSKGFLLDNLVIVTTLVGLQFCINKNHYYMLHIAIHYSFTETELFITVSEISLQTLGTIYLLVVSTRVSSTAYIDTSRCSFLFDLAALPNCIQSQKVALLSHYRSGTITNSTYVVTWNNKYNV